MDTVKLEFDLLVIGAGMAGLSAGGRAAEAGARVLLVEKAEEIGGSGQHAGFLWTVPDPLVLRGWDDGDPHLQRVIFDHFAEGAEWLRRGDFLQSGPTPVLHGRGYQFNVLGHQRQCATTIQSAGGHVALGAKVKELIVDAHGRVEGARIVEEGELIEVRSQWTLLATGGYQADPGLREERIHPNARSIPLRSNPCSNGDGIRLGLQAGGTWAGENLGFYGHLVFSPSKITWDNPNTFVRFSQYQSDYSLLFNEAGKRFTDETQGDFRSSNMLVFEPNARGLLVWDEYIQREHVLQAFVLDAEVEDRLEVALEHGAQGIKVDDLDELKDPATSWGFDGETVVSNITEYNRAARECPEQLQPPRSHDYRPLDEPPYYALVVEPAITFTHGGLRVDDHARVLNRHGRPIPGLLAAGADAGNIFNCGYAGGLALALTFALRAMRTAGWN